MMSLTGIRGLSEPTGSWKMICIRRRSLLQLVAVQGVRSVAAEVDRARGRSLAGAGASCPSVVLPQPDSPTRPRTSPSLDREADAVDGPHVADVAAQDAAVDREVLAQALDPDERIRRWRATAESEWGAAPALPTVGSGADRRSQPERAPAWSVGSTSAVTDSAGGRDRRWIGRRTVAGTGGASRCEAGSGAAAGAAPVTGTRWPGGPGQSARTGIRSSGTCSQHGRDGRTDRFERAARAGLHGSNGTGSGARSCSPWAVERVRHGALDHVEALAAHDPRTGSRRAGPRCRGAAAGAGPPRPCPSRRPVPAYMTATSSTVSATTARSWVISSRAAPALGLDSLDQLEDLGLDRHVEGGRRLVGDEQLGIAGERHRDHHALAHAARQLVRVLLDPPLGGRDADQRSASIARSQASLASTRGGAGGPPRRSGRRS